MAGKVAVCNGVWALEFIASCSVFVGVHGCLFCSYTVHVVFLKPMYMLHASGMARLTLSIDVLH